MKLEFAVREGKDVDLAALARMTAAAGWTQRDASVLAQQVEGARYVVSAWIGDRMIGFARAISDGVTNGYISTVVVDEAYRGKGIGKELIRKIVEGRGGVRWVLHARPEVFGFYEKLDFIRAPDILWRDRRA